MANIKVESTASNNLRSISNSISLIAAANNVVMTFPEGQRIFFEQGNPSDYPKDISGAYAGNGSVIFDFLGGFITGKDEFSSNFLPIIPQTGLFIPATIVLNRDSSASVFYGSPGTLSQVQTNILSGSVGTQPVNTIKLFTVILTSSNGVDLVPISDENIYSYLNSLNVNVPLDRVFYTGDALEIKEPFLTDVFAGSTQYQTSRTSVKVGDSLSIQRTVQVGANSVTESTSVTVTAVTVGTYNDTVTFTPALTTTHILELKPYARVTNPAVTNMARALYHKNRNLVFDSGWIQVVLGQVGSFFSGLKDPLSFYPMIVWNSSKDNSTAIVIANSFRSDSEKVGVQISAGGGYLYYNISSGGVFFNMDTSSLVTTGYIRIFLREI